MFSRVHNGLIHLSQDTKLMTSQFFSAEISAKSSPLPRVPANSVSALVPPAGLEQIVLPHQRISRGIPAGVYRSRAGL